METDGRLYASAAERNKEPILEVLRRVLPSHGTVLEVASGTGQHVVHFAAALPDLEWIPSDPDAGNRASIAAHIRAAGLVNVSPPVDLDVRKTWRVGPVDAVIVANLLHVSAREVLAALLEGAASVLRPGGVLQIYGPFKRSGAHTSEGNARFDAALRAENPDWGLWNLEDVVAAARQQGFRLVETVDMPANNVSLVLERPA